ncbi:MAG: hypothetical protein EP332_02760 [Bacteroidetes bacterium]|nr:MAG: hypothetical protein EP332_02760 [Bacteroidota bacterium]
MDSKRDIRNKRWLSRWERMRRKGILRYSLIYGFIYCLLTFGFILSGVKLVSAILPDISSLIQDTWIGNLLLAMAFGIVLSLIQYVVNELRYRRLGSKYPSAVRMF